MVMLHPKLWRNGLRAIGLFALIASVSAQQTNGAQQINAAQQTDGLQAALRAALTMHPAVSGKQAQVKSREFGGDTARAQRYPSISAQAQQYAETTEDGVTGENLSSPASLRARQPLWAFGRIDSSIALADAETELERTDLLRVQRQLLEQTAVAYATVLGSRERLQVAAAATDAHRQLYEQIGRREQGQLASSADVRLAATRLSQSRARLERYHGELEVALSELRALTQVPFPAQQLVSDAMLQLPAEGDALLQIVQQASGDILVKKQAIERARANVDQVKTSSRPTVYLQAEQFYDVPSYMDDNRVSVVIEGSYEGLGFATRGRTGAARSQQQAAEDDLRDAINETDRIVRRLLSNRQLQQQLIEVQEESLTELDAVLGSYQRQYIAGTKSWLDVLNIQRELSDQQLQRAQARSEWMIYSLQLLALAGGLDALADLNSTQAMSR